MSRPASLLTRILAFVFAVASAPLAFAQGEPIRIGLLTVKTGPLARAASADGARRSTVPQGSRNYTLAGRKVELVVGDTGGNPRARRPRRRSWSSATAST